MTIGCHVSGYGPVRLLVLHGWLSDKGVYDVVAPWFEQARYSIAQMDFRGYGRSRNLHGNYEIDEIADDALALASELGWPEFHVLGHSMGGMVLQKMALKAPARVLSGIAAAPVAASGFPMDEGTRAFFQSAADDDAALTEIFNILTGKRHAESFLQGLTQAARRATTRAAFLGYLDAWTRTNFAAEVGALATPVLVIAGAHDGALGPGAMRESYLKQLKNVQMKVVEGAGHYPMLETPAEFFDLVDGYLAPRS
ncbi:MAG: alpha/beta hydrolase [Rhodoferax sp.]|uniref:alpha/beta fold hydrolase n=1 Tax=Rhodoferax sp. TaxID=50421 RepID=UPI00263A0E04|nr:alpha/beta hydrolase [Rhodoferax sp.]MDD5332283.1 alpha/beta hydrolase [Rhodoferax sp.]